MFFSTAGSLKVVESLGARFHATGLLTERLVPLCGRLLFRSWMVGWLSLVHYSGYFHQLGNQMNGAALARLPGSRTRRREQRKGDGSKLDSSNPLNLT